LDWSPLDQYLVTYLVEPAMIPTVLASTFAAALELVREGHLEAHQQGSFTPLYLRKKQSGGTNGHLAGDGQGGATDGGVTGGGDGGGSGMSAESGNA
jgi:segregation and condensation protein A